MSSGDYLDSADIAKAYPRPKGEVVPKIHPKDVDRAPFGQRNAHCGDNFGAMGSCIRPKQHDDAHRDVNGNGWTRPAPEKRFVQPTGRPQDTSVVDGGSQVAANAQSVRNLQKQQFGQVHMRYFSSN